MFDLVLTMSVGVLLRLGGAVKKIGFVKKQKNYFLKIQKLIPNDKKKVIVVTQLWSAGISF